MNTSENASSVGAVTPERVTAGSASSAVVATDCLPEHAGASPAVLAGPTILPSTPELPLWPTCAAGSLTLVEELRAFDRFGKTSTCTIIDSLTDLGYPAVPEFSNEFWTRRQRQASSLHELSYRASFKPQLPRFFIERLSQPGDVVLDPFGGRGTTALEAALCGRIPISNDVNPLSLNFTAPRLHPPTAKDIAERLEEIGLRYGGPLREDLLPFFHPETLSAIHALQDYFQARRSTNSLDYVDEWLLMVAMSRLTGHSAGFFSGRTLPPNQAISIESQRRLNAKHGLVPPPRDVKNIVLKKSKQLLQDVTPEVRRTLELVSLNKKLLCGSADQMPQVRDCSVQLVVTSPPFLDVVDYAADNWLRCWFVGIDPEALALTVTPSLNEWSAVMTNVLCELRRVLKPGGHIAFEVGEVHNGRTELEKAVLFCGAAAGLDPVVVLINDQQFTKTSNCWAITNGKKGTNTNRIVVFQKKG